MSNTDSQDELTKAIMALVTEPAWQSGSAHFVLSKDDVSVTVSISKLRAFINAHTQKAVDNAREVIKMADKYTFSDGTTLYGERELQKAITEARIDELEATRHNIINNNTVQGIVGSINNRIATLTNQPNGSKE